MSAPLSRVPWPHYCASVEIYDNETSEYVVSDSINAMDLESVEEMLKRALTKVRAALASTREEG